MAAIDNMRPVKSDITSPITRIRKKRCLIFYPWVTVSTNPTLVFLLSILKEQGFSVDIICKSVSLLDQSLFDRFDNLRIYPHFGQLNTPINKRSLQRLKRWVSLTRNLGAHLKLRNLKRLPHDVVLAIDPDGLLAAIEFKITSSRKIKLIYVSFELLLVEEANDGDEELLACLHSKAINHIDGLVIQDDNRRDLLIGTTTTRRIQTVLLPVAPENQQLFKSEYLRNELDIAADNKIILFQGSCYFWAGNHEWETLLEIWPPNWTLVVHCGYRLNKREEQFVRYLSKYKNFRLSDKPTSPQNLPSITASADIGLISYHPNPAHWTCNNNLRAVGMSSGKFSYFMMCGIPVICNSKTNLGSIVASNQVGQVFSAPEQSVAAIHHVLSDYHGFSLRARSFYDTKLDPKLHKVELVELLDFQECR